MRKSIILSVVLVVGLTGCMHAGQNGGETGANVDLLDRVPSDQDVVLTMDGDIVTDERTRRIVMASQDEYDSYEQYLEEESGRFNTVQNLDSLVFFGERREVEQSVGFGAEQRTTTTTKTIGGTLYKGDLNKTSFIENNRQSYAEGTQVEQSSSTYKGVQIDTYVPDSTFADNFSVAQLNENIIVTSSNEDVVRSVIDVHAGDSEPLSGDLRESVESDEYVNFAAGSNSFGYRGSSVNISSAEGSFGYEGDNVSIEATITTQDSESAQQLQGLLQFLAGGGLGQFNQESDVSIFEDLNVNREGTEINVRLTQPVDDVVQYIEDDQNASVGTNDQP